MNADDKMPSASTILSRCSALSDNASRILATIRAAAEGVNREKPVRLVAVSKLKPAEDILALHTTPIPIARTSAATGSKAPDFDTQSHFGENYVQELIEKSSTLPRTIKWHFIGGLQSNKCRGLGASVPNLWCVESIDSVTKATKLDAGRAECVQKIEADKAKRQGSESGVVREFEKVEDEDGDEINVELSGTENAQRETASKPEVSTEFVTSAPADWSALPWFSPKLRVMVQVNTSGEDSKSGCRPGEETLSLCRHILENCPHLRLHGFMTIGAIGRSLGASKGEENEDFVKLVEVRDEVKGQLVEMFGEEKVGHLELSMGMSADYEVAIRMGSDEVRVGSSIFGERPPKGEKQTKE